MDNLVIEEFSGEIYQYYPLGKYVVRAPGVCGGRPTFKYTRIEVAGILDLLAAGDTIDNLVVGYRGRISRHAIEEVLQLAKQALLTIPPVFQAA